MVSALDQLRQMSLVVADTGTSMPCFASSPRIARQTPAPDVPERNAGGGTTKVGPFVSARQIRILGTPLPEFSRSRCWPVTDPGLDLVQPIEIEMRVVQKVAH